MGYERILVPTDGSENAERVIEEAIDVANQYGASVHGLYVLNTGAIASPDVQFREQYVERGEELGAEAVAEVAAAADEAGVSVTTSVVHGTPDDEILEYAADKDVDLIVVGTHGRSGLRHALLGSVAERVIRQSETPVLVVRTSD